MTRIEAEKLVTRWDAEALRRGRPDKRKHLWRILDCLAGWRGYDAEVAEALDALHQTPEVAAVREACINAEPINRYLNERRD